MKEKIKIILFFILVSFFLVENVFAMDISVFSLIISENSSGYVCPGSSIGCSSLSSIYKIEKRGEDIYVCPGSSIRGCSSLDALYKTSKYNQKTTYICPSNSFGSCSTFNVLYKISKQNESMNYICHGSSIGDCSIFNVLYKVSKHDADTTFVCPGDSIGNCSVFNVLYKFKKTNTQSTENYLNELENPLKNLCPSNSTYINEQCLCNEGYIASGRACITYTQNCQNKYGINSYGDKNYCYCSSGYEFNSEKTVCVKSIKCPPNSTKVVNNCICNDGYIMRNNKCITYTEDCIQHFGQNIYGVEGSNGNSSCHCKKGYEWNVSRTACIKSIVCPLNSTKINDICICNECFVFKNGQCITHTQDCQLTFGDYVIGRKGDTGNSLCECEAGYVWNSNQTACIKAVVNLPTFPILFSDNVIEEEKKLITKVDENLSKRVSGNILLQVEKSGEAWYVYPNDRKKYYLDRPADAFDIMRKLGLGATHQFITSHTIYPDHVLGKILLDVEKNGEAYYIYPKDKKAYYLGRPADAFRIMRELGLGITNSDIRKIDVGEVK